MTKNEKEMENYYEILHRDHGDEKKLKVRVRQLENELEQMLKKIDIVSRAKGFTKSRSRSKVKVERTQFRNAGRKPLYPGGSNYSSPANRVASNKRSNKYSPTNRSTGSNLRKNSPSAVSTGSKKKNPSSKKGSDKGSPGNRLYSPRGRPRDNSPGNGQRKPGAVQRVQEAFSPKAKEKGPSKAEIYKRYNGLRNRSNKRSNNGSNASPSDRPGSSSIYSNASKKKKVKKNTSNRSNSARSRKAKNLANEREVKMQDTNGFQKSPVDELKGMDMDDIEAKISNLEKMLEKARQ
jgi:hypothetical protein